MTSTRLITITFVLGGSAGLALMGLGVEPLPVITGALLLTASGVILLRHFWREAGVKREREHRAHAATLSQAVDLILRETEQTRTSTTESVAQLRSRFDAFAQGILEHIAQVAIDTSHVRDKLVETRDVLKRLDQQADESLRDRARLIKSLEQAERRSTKHREGLLSQISGVIGVYSTLRPQSPYPPFGGWAIGGDCAQRLLSLMLKTEPRYVLEAGSGLSTLLAAQALDLIGEDGRIISLEHEAKWLENTKGLLEEHGVQDRVELVEAPLVEVKVSNEVHIWYDLENVVLPEDIALLFIDGPPMATGPLARYPALPLLHKYLAPSAVILMDDASRPDEQEAVERWQSEIPGLEVHYHPDAKGTVEIVMPTQ